MKTQMNQIIRKQLEQCKVADLSNYNKETRTFFIPKYNQTRVLEGKSYIIKLDPTLLQPNPGDTFHINWNKGILPLSNSMLIEVSKVNGKVIYVDGIGYDLESDKVTSGVWAGWLPIEKITVVKGA